MNFHVVVERLCSCAKQRGMEQIRTCTNRFDAEAEAYDWSESLNSSFCGRHTFDVARVGEHFVITVEEDAQANICETGVE